MPEGDPGHQFQMLLKPLQRALAAGDVEAALRFAGHLFDVGGGPKQYQDRKVYFLVKAVAEADPAVQTAFTAKVLEWFGPHLTEDSRARLEGRLTRL